MDLQHGEYIELDGKSLSPTIRQSLGLDDIESKKELTKTVLQTWVETLNVKPIPYEGKISQDTLPTLHIQLFVNENGVIPIINSYYGIDFDCLKELDCYFCSTYSFYDFSSSNSLPIIFRVKKGIWLYIVCNFTSSPEGGVRVLCDSSTKEEALKWAMKHLKGISKKITPKISYIVQNCSSLSFKDADISKKELNLDYYNEDFALIDIQLQKWAVNWDKTGVAILHGEPGTGKTSYIRYLASVLDKVTYVPSGLTSEIGTPAFLAFLAEHPKRIYVIEDAENVVISDGENRSSALQNLLNATDGLMGDIIKSKFILTFNTSIDNVDTALLRQGRAEIIYKFEKLNACRAKALLQKLGKETAPESQTLAEIFNAPTAGNNKLNQPKATMGFQ